jgi:hypothetical protein
MNCIDRLSCGPSGGSLLYGKLHMQSISGLNQQSISRYMQRMLHWHLLIWVLQLQGSS